MPVGFNSPARNLFLLGSSGAQTVTNFFKSIDQSSTTDGVFLPDEIRYNYTDQKYVLAGSAADSNSKGFGWFEKRDETGAKEFDVRVEAGAGVNTTLRAMELDSNNNLIVAGFSGTAPWIAKYSNSGVLDWQSTTFSANVRYTGLASDSNGNYYASGRTSYLLPDTQAFVEKFDSNGNPGWGKSAFMLGRDVVLRKISANSRGEVVAVGFLEDDSADKGYIVKIDTSTGEVLWDRTLERNISGFGLGNPSTGSTDSITPADVRCMACYIDSNDQIYVVGSIDGNSPNDNGVGEFLIKYSPEGNIIWQRENNTTDYVNLDGAPNMVPFDVKSDGETEQTVVLSVQDQGAFALNNSDVFISKYSKNGDLVYRRQISKGGENLGNASLDADPSFYYILFEDQQVDGLAGTPDRYTFGKVSTSGNGLGAFQYDDGAAPIIDYTIVSNAESKIGRLSDGSVRNDSSDLITYPFTANKLVFDDLATHVSNKKRQMDNADSFEYSGSPAIRIADFQQELNLLGDVYSGSGEWLDQSGKGNNGVTSVTVTTSAEEPFPGAGSIEFDGTGDHLLIPASSDFNYGTNNFTIEFWWYRTSNDRQALFHGSWGQDWSIGIDFNGAANNQKLGMWASSSGSSWDMLIADGGGNGITTGTPALNQWSHIAYVRNGSDFQLYLNGTSVGQVTNSSAINSKTTTRQQAIGAWWNSETAMSDVHGYLSNFRIVIGSAIYTSNFTPPTSALTNTGQTAGTDYYTGSEWSPAGINNPEEAFTTAVTGSGSNGGNFGPFTYTFATPVTGVTSARIRGSLGASSGQVGGTTNCILVDGTDVTQKFKNAGGFSGSNPWVDVTAEVGSTWNTFRVQGVSGSTNPNVSGIEVNGVQLLTSTQPTGTMLLTAQGASITDASDSNRSITVNGNAVAAVGGTTTNTVAHNAGGYFEFDGTDDYISGSSTILFGTDTGSIEAWFKTSDTSTPGGAIYSESEPGDNTYWGHVRIHGGKPRFVLDDNSVLPEIEANVTVSDGNWHHVVVTGDGSNYGMYVDGVSYTPSYITGSGYKWFDDTPGLTTYTIGALERASIGNYFNGEIGEVRIYSRALTAAQVFQNYNATKSRFGLGAASTNPGLTSTRTP